MIKVYFDDVLIDTDSYTQLDNEYKLFTESFKLGSTASNSFYLSVVKSAVSSHPSEVRIEDDTTTWNFIVDNITANDNVYTYVLVEKLVDFNFDYDASILINAKAELEEDCYLSDIWHDMCDKAGVEYDETYVFENDIVVTWYDSRVQARKYLSFIAELQSGYACMLENGKQSFKKQNRSSVKTIDADECSDLIVGEKKKITRVVYDGGAFKWEFGDETGDTLYLQKDNVFIVNEQIVENIYNNIKDFEFYIIDVPKAPMDSTIKAGDIITFDDNGTLYPTIAQYKMSYAGGWTGGYQLKVSTTKQQETQVTRTAENVKNLKVDVDRLSNEFSVVAEEIEKLTDYIKTVGTTDDYLKIPNTPQSNGAINKLSIKGFEIIPLYPGMTYPSNYTYPGALNFYTLIFDTVSTFDSTPNYVYINSPIPIQKLGTVYDELLIESNKVKVIQRIGYDDINEQWSELSTPITHELNDVLLPTFEGDTYVSVKYFDNLIFSAEYIIKNDLTSVFTTQIESSAQFNINSDEISSKVSKDKIISEINQTAELIKILANKIALEGLVTANENFKVLLDGSIEAVNATLRGNVYLPNGGKVIGGDGIFGNLQFKSDGQYENYGWLGFNHNLALDTYTNKDVSVEVTIPENFTILSAILTLYHTPIYWFDFESATQFWGYSRNLKLYKVTGTANYQFNMAYASEYETILSTGSLTEIVNAFGVSAYTPTNTSSPTQEEQDTIDIKASLSVGRQKLIIRSNDPVPSTNTVSCQKTGMARAVINVFGYIRTNEQE
jgi:hypothetical protein